MPDKPNWYSHIDDALREMRVYGHSEPVTAKELTRALKVGPRTAQNIIRDMPNTQVGKRFQVKRIVAMEFLKEILQSDDGQAAQNEYDHFLSVLDRLKREHKQNPPCLIEAPASVQRTQLDELAQGTLGETGWLKLGPGVIHLEFIDGMQARELLLRLAMAIGNDQPGFDERVKRIQEQPIGKAQAPLKIVSGRKVG